MIYLIFAWCADLHVIGCTALPALVIALALCLLTQHTVES